MAHSVRSVRFHAGRGFARPSFPRRNLLLGRDDVAPSQTPTAVMGGPTPSQTGPAGVTLPPRGVAALVGIVIMLSTLVLGFAAWRLYVYRRKRAALASECSEKAAPPKLSSDTVDEELKLKRSYSGSSSNTVVVSLLAPKTAVTRERSPGDLKINLGYQPKTIYVATEEAFKHISPPGITITPAAPGLQINPPPANASLPSPIRSPRTAASMSPRFSQPPTTSTLPRLVVVESTFVPTLHDELEIREGETLRLLEEYEDEWCLVQRVGPQDAEKGVIPRFCVIDKPPAISSKKSKHVPRLSTNRL